jgi:hypothetical protein
MKLLLRRLLAYARGDFEAAAAVDAQLVKDEGEVAWLTPPVTHDIANYALQAARRSAEHAGDAAARLVDKAANLVTVVITALTAAVGFTGFVLASGHNSCPKWVALALWFGTDLVLLSSAVNAFLATAESLGGGLNISRLSGADGDLPDALAREEALVWHRTALREMATGTRRGNDLFAARRLLLAGVALSVPAVVLGILAVR